MFKVDKAFTLIVAAPGTRWARRYSLPVGLVATIGFLGSVLAVAFVFSTLHYYHMWKRTGEFSQLKNDMEQARRENAGLRAVSGKLNEKISSLEVTATRLKFLSESDEDGLGGIGGPSTVASPLLTLNHRDLLKRFRTLDQRRITVETELRRLQDHYTTRSILLAALPTLMPVRGYPSDRFGYRHDPFTGKKNLHPGLDISAPYGAKVLATGEGEVAHASRQQGYGRLVRLRHRFGISTRYGHLAEITVQLGQKVKRGDVIGYVGSSGRTTGPHLHYEVRLSGQPLDPLRFFQD